MTNYKIDRGVAIPRSHLLPNEWNPNHTKPRTQEAIAESIQQFGQVLELLVRPHPTEKDRYQIVDGEHRFNVLPETVYCNVIHDLPEAQAKKLTIILNETRGEADKIELAQLLAEISEELGSETQIGLPYEEKDLDELIKLAEVDWDSFDDNFEPEEGGAEEGQSDGFTTIAFKVPTEAMDVLNQAYALVQDERTLNKDRAIAWGQVIEMLSAEYLAMPR